MEEQFHLLDLQIAKFTEFGVCMIFSRAADLDHLRNSSEKLVEQWPILGARINLLDYQPRYHSKICVNFRTKICDYSLDEYLPGLSQDLDTFDSPFDPLFDSPVSWRDIISPPVLSMSAIALRDACLLKISVQHALCDATGLYNIIQAYCSLLRRESVKPLTPRSTIKLADNSARIMPDSLTSEPISARLAQFQITTSQLGWRPVLSAFFKSALFKPKHRKIFRTPILDDNQLVKARTANERVTTHDLLMAYLWKASAASPSWKQRRNDRQNRYPPFSFALSIEQHLYSTSELHNRWVVVNVPNPKQTTNNEEEDVVQMACHLRSTIINARSSAYLQPILDYYEKANDVPIMPWKDGLSTGIFCSSWSQNLLCNMKFKLGETPEVQPMYTQAYVGPPPILRSLRQSLDNTVLTWKDRENCFWLSGTLDNEVWTELDRLYRRAI
ncbi:hypothetical protein DPV78_003407 [Talaromyces pinophilus]|nr:hypothetical protein DPV78_003407 [Talaromyces pinophilus]